MLKKYYGDFGGCFVPESLMTPLNEIATAFEEIKTDAVFQAQLNDFLKNYAGRPTPLTYAAQLSKLTGREIYLKREDLLHGGAHKTNNTLGQGLLAKRLGKTRLIAETGAGQHGVATAMVGAMLGMQVEIYMGAVDIERQASNVQRMKLFGAQVHAVTTGSATLKDAINEALRDWTANVQNTYYVFGTAAGPAPFPELVRYFQSIIGVEAREQMLMQTQQLPDAIFACVGGGSNAIGIFSGFLNDASVKLFGAEASGEGLKTQKHAATILRGREGVFHGMKSLFLQTTDGQIAETHSVSAGLDYPGVGPEHAYLNKIKRVQYCDVTDKEALSAYRLIAEKEGILAALESSHALALALREAEHLTPKSKLLINLSGRGDKDLTTYLAAHHE